MREVFSLAFELYGPYETVDKATNIIDVLALKGYQDDNIMVIANEDIATNLKKRVNANVISVLQDEEDDPLEHLFNTLDNLDLSDVQAERYNKAMKENKIIIAIDTDYLRMGNQPDQNTDVLIEKI